jgi:cold shock protein
MRTGTVKWFNPRKGYGFISPVDGGFDVYVHISAVERAGMAELRQGQEIIFDVAVDVRTGEMFAENLSFAPEGKEETHGGSQRPAASNAVSFIGRLTGHRTSRIR